MKTLHDYMLMSLPTPNIVNQKKGYYISYNNEAINIYGDITTAIVTDNMDCFLILAGNHVKELKSLNNYYECKEYFKANIHLKVKQSDNI